MLPPMNTPQSPDAVKVMQDTPERKLLVDFYTSDAYDPKAARPADVVEAAIRFTLARLSSSPSGIGADQLQASEQAALVEFVAREFDALLEQQRHAANIIMSPDLATMILAALRSQSRMGEGEVQVALGGYASVSDFLTVLAVVRENVQLAGLFEAAAEINRASNVITALTPKEQ